MKVTLIRTYTPNVGPSKVTKHIVEAPTPDQVWAICFRQYFNKERYANSTYTRFENPEHRTPYREWISDINNYANNGGDMS
mgnify:FL=1